MLTSGSWPHSNAMLLFEVDNYPDVPSLTLRLYIAPGPEDIRQQLVRLADANSETFSTRRNAYDDWIIVYEQTLLDPAVYHQLVGDQRKTYIRAAWESFRQQTLPAIQELIAQQEWIWAGKGTEGLPPVPSAEHYKQAFRAIRKDLSDGQMAMLCAQYRAPNHTITATELAHAAGYQSFHGANLQYGRMGTLLREVLDYWDEATLASYVLSYFCPPRSRGNSEWLFVMHDQVTQALRELRWCR